MKHRRRKNEIKDCTHIQLARPFVARAPKMTTKSAMRCDLTTSLMFAESQVPSHRIIKSIEPISNQLSTVSGQRSERRLKHDG